MKALLIEPDPGRRQQLAETLRQQGFEPAIAEELEAACAVQGAERCSLVVLAADSLERGVELCRRLRALPPSGPFWLLASADGSPADHTDDLLAAGADDVLPFPLEDRHLNVRLALAKRRLESPGAGKSRGGPSRAEATGKDAPSVSGRSELMFRTLIENMPDLVFIVGRDGVVQFTNHVLAPGAGQGPQGTTHCSQFFAPGHVESLLGMIRRVLDTRKVQVLPVADLWGRWWESRLIPLGQANSSADASLVICTDMTDRQRSVDLLRESEQRYRLIADNVTDLIWIGEFGKSVRLPARLAPDAATSLAAGMVECWRFSYVSPSVRRALGYSVREFLTIRLDALLTCESCNSIRQLLAEELLLETQPDPDLRRSRVVEIQQHAKAGHICHGEATATFLRNAEGEITAVLGVTRDISQKKLAEAEVRKEQDLLRQLLELFERERELIAFEIHDGVTQQMTGALFNFEASSHLAAASPNEAKRTYREGLRLLRESIEEVRRLIGGLRPPALDAFGIIPAIEQLIRENLTLGGLEIELVTEGDFDRLARPLENALFRIVQESLTNARRHSQTRKIVVELGKVGGKLRLAVRDWGIGFNPDADIPTDHFGLRGIRERARLLGGSATFDTAPGKGTCILVELPLL